MKKFEFNINGSDYQVHIKSIEGDDAKIEVNGTPYSVKIYNEAQTNKTPILVRQEVANKAEHSAGKFTPVSPSSKPSTTNVKSPLPGNILKVNFNDGDTFVEGDVLLIMESMKMENNILAEKDGTIVKVCVKTGDAVLQDAVLFEIQ
jgi:biotin carboxyl carrier protein